MCSPCLEQPLLDVDVDRGRQVDAHERVDRLRRRVEDVDEPLVRAHLEVLARRPPVRGCYLMIFVTRPAPTVRPPSRMAKRRPSSMAIGWISSTVISVLSPGMTISVPAGSVTTPVTSVVRK